MAKAVFERRDAMIPFANIVLALVTKWTESENGQAAVAAEMTLTVAQNGVSVPILLRGEDIAAFVQEFDFYCTARASNSKFSSVRSKPLPAGSDAAGVPME